MFTYIIDTKKDTQDMIVGLHMHNLKKLQQGKYEVKIQKPKRTNKQNRAMHLFFSIIADMFNENGLTFKYTVINKTLEMPYTTDIVKNYVWRPFQIVMFGKKSTTQLTTKELTQVADSIEKALSLHGHDIQFPSINQLLDDDVR